MINLKIIDGTGHNFTAKVSSNGELIVRPQLDFSSSNAVTMDTANIAFNVWGPETNKEFILTTMLISTNKDIGVNGTNVEIYEADAADSTTILGQAVKINLLKNSNLPLTGLLSKITSGNYLNAKHDDAAVNAEVFVTIGGYFAPTIQES